MRARNNSEIEGFTAKADLESPAYKSRVSQPVMEAIDALPQAYRALINEFGYIEVYLAWRDCRTPAQIEQEFRERRVARRERRPWPASS